MSEPYIEINDSGITSLAGFAYQIRVFVYYMSKIIDDTWQIEFETLEDVAVKTITPYLLDKKSDTFRSLLKNQETYWAVQVKRTKINKDTKQKIIFNWLLLEKSKQNISKYILFTEQSYDNKGDLFDTTSIDLFNIIVKSNKRANSLISKVKNSYKNDYDGFKNAYEKIQEKYYFISENNLDEMIRDGFSLSFHRGATCKIIYKLRIKEFVQNITNEIMRTINNKTPYICTYKNMMYKVEDICDRIKDNKYEPSFAEFKKCRIINLSDNSIAKSREYKQLTKCSLTEQRIIEHLLFQQYYESIKFRYYEDNRLDYIENIEETTYSNFCDAKEYLEDIANDTPRRRLNTTKEKYNCYATNNQIRYGACIHLTNEKTDNRHKISWEDEV